MGMYVSLLLRVLIQQERARTVPGHSVRPVRWSRNSTRTCTIGQHLRSASCQRREVSQQATSSLGSVVFLQFIELGITHFFPMGGIAAAEDADFDRSSSRSRYDAALHRRQSR